MSKKLTLGSKSKAKARNKGERLRKIVDRVRARVTLVQRAAIDKAREAARAGAAGLGAKIGAFKNYVSSPEFEEGLDELLRRHGCEKRLRETDLNRGNRQMRVNMKLLALVQIYGQEVAAVSALGAELGKLFGPGVQANLAAIFGGVQLTLIAGEVIYVFTFSQSAKQIRVSYRKINES